MRASPPPPQELTVSRPDVEPLVLAPEYLLLPEGVVSGHAVVLRGSGIEATGSVESVAARYPESVPLSLPGKMLMPGFIDAHHHLTQTFGKALAFGEPSEIFKRLWVPLEGFLNEELVYLSAKLASLEALRGGFTTVADAGTRSQGYLAALARAVEEAGIRCVLGAICNDGPNQKSGKEGEAQRADILAQADAHLAAYAAHPLISPSLAISIPEIASDAMLGAVYARCAEAGRIFQTHVNEHLVAVERSLVDRGLRPLEHLKKAGALGPYTLCAHCTLVTPAELRLLQSTDAAVSYNPVASQWKGNAVAPAVQMHELGIRLGLGTDGTRSDAFRLVDAAEASQRLCFGLATGDFSCGGGDIWLAMGARGSADVLGLAGTTGTIQPGLEADLLLIDVDVPEMTPSWDLPWELVRFGDRSQIEGVFVGGRLRLWHGRPLDWDADALLARVRELVYDIVPKAPIKRVHGTADEYRAMRQRLLA